MNQMIRKTVLAALLLAALPAANAAVQNYNFSGTIDSGAYNGQSFSGSFSFDDAALTGIGSEWLNVGKFAMSFLGSSYALSDAVAPVEVAYDNGAFLGLSYSANPSWGGFSLIADATPFLSYDTTAGLSGAGSVAFTQAVPEPESYAMLLAGLGLMGMVARRRKA